MRKHSCCARSGNGILATNIANADTPNYKARDIDFRAAMASAQAGTANPVSLQPILPGSSAGQTWRHATQPSAVFLLPRPGHPDGEYELADGTMITVAGGKVEGIETPQAETPTAEEAPMEADSQFDEMNATITYLQAENDALKNKLGELESKFNQGFSEMLSVLEGFSKTPVADPIQNPKNNFRIVEPKADKIERFLERVKTLN